MTPEEISHILWTTPPQEISIGVFRHAAELIQSREQAVAEERERCAKIAYHFHGDTTGGLIGEKIAAKIREDA